MTAIEIDPSETPVSSRNWNLALLAGVFAPVAMLLFLPGTGATDLTTVLQGGALASTLAIVPAGIFMVVIRLAEQDRRRSILLWIAFGVVAASIYALPAAWFLYDVSPSDVFTDRLASAVHIASTIYACGIVGSLSAWAVVRFAGRQ